jgi:twitching motility two-component system response regulator PilH
LETVAKPGLQGLKVLVIDDSKTIRRTAETLLTKEGCEVFTAVDGFDALAKIADHQPDIVFVDIMMPRLDGYQTCSLIKHNKVYKSIPVIMLSSKARNTTSPSRSPRTSCSPRSSRTSGDDRMPLILIVDDSPTEVHVMQRALEKHGYKTAVAGDGAEGVRLAREIHPDLIFMDIVMPGMNGYQATRTLTNDPTTSAIPIVMVTSKGQETDKIWGLRQGAIDYMVKPVSPADLVAKAQSTLAA